MTDFLFALNSCQALVLKDGSCVPLAITMMVAALMLLMLVMMMVMVCSFAHILAVFGVLVIMACKGKEKESESQVFSMKKSNLLQIFGSVKKYSYLCTSFKSKEI